MNATYLQLFQNSTVDSNTIIQHLLQKLKIQQLVKKYCASILYLLSFRMKEVSVSESHVESVIPYPLYAL